MATKKQPLRGVIHKVVHVEIRNDKAGVTASLEEPGQGYGLVRGEDGQEVFFIDSAVQANSFADLRVGQRVTFQIEDGPLMRAEYVRIS